jgi:hypothetical protein
VVITAAATLPVFGRLITDPVETVAELDTTFAVVLGALTFMIATIGINIVANFVSPAFDFSNVNPQKINWRTGGMIAAVGSVLITPWNLYSSPDVIHYTLDTLGAFVGPLYGVLIADYYLIRKGKVVVDDLYTLEADGKYHYSKGYNPVAIVATGGRRRRRDGRGVVRLDDGGRLQLVHRRGRGVRPALGDLPEPHRPHARTRGRRRLSTVRTTRPEDEWASRSATTSTARRSATWCTWTGRRRSTGSPTSP